jgi:hypothetical protein
MREEISLHYQWQQQEEENDLHNTETPTRGP